MSVQNSFVSSFFNTPIMYNTCATYFRESGFSQKDVNVGGRNRSALNKSGKLHWLGGD